MATTRNPKSILKKTQYHPTGPRSKEERDREVALYHANLLQERKDIELTILLSTETLIDYPLSRDSPYSASNPSPADAQTFKNLLQPFQPSDYDALILERNINDYCGYTLCSKARLKDGKGGKYRIIGMEGKAKDFKVVERHEVEKWCSEACARRALWVRVQLSESPAWERAGSYTADVDLLDEPKSEQDQVAEDLSKMDLTGSDAQDKKQDSANLALERGDRGLSAKKGLVDVTIQEKDVTRPAEPPSLDVDNLGGKLDHLTLEGHTTSFNGESHRRRQDDLFGEGEDEDTGMDWL